VIAAAELAIQRQLSATFIEADAIEVVLMRPTWSSDGAGGTIEGPLEAQPVQRMRLIPLGDGAQERFTANGQAVTPSYMLMGLHTASMERWDELTINGRQYSVVFINENKQYEIKGEVAYRVE
jgi:hypothetical protein